MPLLWMSICIEMASLFAVALGVFAALRLIRFLADDQRKQGVELLRRLSRMEDQLQDLGSLQVKVERIEDLVLSVRRQAAPLELS